MELVSEKMCRISNLNLFYCKHNGLTTYEPPHDKNNEMASAPSEDSDQTGRIIVFAVRSVGS